MKSIAHIATLLVMVISLSACTDLIYSMGQPNTLEETIYKMSWSNEWDMIKEDFEDVKQKAEILSAAGELLITISDNEEIFYFIKNLEYDQWDYSINKIPSQASKLYTIINYREVDGQMLEEGRNIVYHDASGYYMITKTSSVETLQVKMSNKAALYLTEFAGLGSSGESFIYGDSNSNDNTSSKKTSLPFNDLTYEGMLAASKVNRIDIQKKAIVKSISSNEEIIEFLLSLNTSDWSCIENIPNDAEYICAIIFYQEGRREYAGKMMEQWRQVLYFDGEKYYVDMLTADDGDHPNFNETYPQRFLLPNVIGKELSKASE